MSDLESRLSRIGALAEPVRRALYRYVVTQREPVTREQAASAVDVPHHVAKFNLDRLVEEGLLEADYRRPPGRSGPGAGRPAKTYRRADTEVEVSLPERRYELAARVLAHAVANAERADTPIASEVDAVAAEAGRDIGAVQPKARQRNRVGAIIEALSAEGYEPHSDRDGITLANCPFHALAQDETELVCGMNRSFLAGLLDGLGIDDYRAELDPAPGRCCVRVTKA